LRFFFDRCHQDERQDFRVLAKQIGRRCPACRPQTGWRRGPLFLQMSQYLFNDHRVFDADDYLDLPAASTAGLYVDMEDAL
jgi:hypothetical protein